VDINEAPLATLSIAVNKSNREREVGGIHSREQIE
jgi:hypothetical protein